MSYIYKILRNSEWQNLNETGFFAGSPVDARDGYIHLSFSDQVGETAAKHFAGADGLVLVQFNATDFGEALKAEPSRGGALFPHLYGVLPLAAMNGHWILSLSADGTPVIPPLPVSHLPEA